MTRKCLSAWTALDFAHYPPYVNVSNEEGGVTVTVRAPPDDAGVCGVTVSAPMPQAAFNKMLDELRPQRRYLPSLAELIDRLTITQLKMIFISEHRATYEQERDDIEHDVALILDGLGRQFGVRELRAVTILMLTNRFIWENESRARAGGDDQDKFLKLTHSINGIRNAAKNVISDFEGGRKDHKIDCLAADLDPAFGHWGNLL